MSVRTVRSTSLADGIRAAESAFDAVCKRLLGERQVVSRILVDTVSGFEGADPDVVAHDCVASDPSYGVPLSRDVPIGPNVTQGAPQSMPQGSPPSHDVNTAGHGAPYADDVPDEKDAPHARDRPTGHVAPPSRGALTDPGPAARLDTDDATVTEGLAIFDVRTRAVVPGTMRVVELDLEGQGKASPGYPLLRRAMFYCGRMLSRQGADVVAHSAYGALRRVVSVWVVFNPSKDLAGTVLRARMDTELLVGEPAWDVSDVDCVEIAIMCVGGDSRERGGALGMLDVLFAQDLDPEEKLTILADEYGMMMTEQIEEGVQDMCTLAEVWRENIREEVTREVTDEITRDVTDKVTRDVTQQVTRDVTDKVKRETARDVLIANVRALMDSLSTTAAVALDLLKASDDERSVVVAALDA